MTGRRPGKNDLDFESGNDTDSPVRKTNSPSRKMENDFRKSMKLHYGRQHHNIIPEEYEPHSTHGRSGFHWNKQNNTRYEETYRSSEYNTTGASWERGIERGTTGTLRESIGEEDPNVQKNFMSI